MRTRGLDSRTKKPTEFAELFANKDPVCFELKLVSNSIGLGVFALKDFEKGEFLLNYRGRLSQENKVGPAIFGIQWQNKRWTIDGTSEDQSLGRFINDTDPFHKPNCEPHLHSFEQNGEQTCVLWFKAISQIVKGDELRYDYKNQFQPWKLRKNWSETESGWQFLHNVPKDGSFQLEIPGCLRHSPIYRDNTSSDESLRHSVSDRDPLSMKDNDVVQDNTDAPIDLFSPIRKKLRGMSLYAKQFKGNDDARSVSSISEAKSGTESGTKSVTESVTNSGTPTRSSITQTSSSKTTEGATISSDDFSDTSASSKQNTTSRRRNQNKNLKPEMSSQKAEAEDCVEVQVDYDCSTSSQPEAQAQQVTSIDSSVSQSVEQHVSQIELSEKSEVVIQSLGENSKARATAGRKAVRKRLSTITISAAETSVQKKNRKQSFLLYGLKKPVTSRSLQIVPKHTGKKKTKWVKSDEETDDVLNQLLSEGHQTSQTTLSKTLSDIEEEPAQPELTPSCSYSKKGLERRNTLSSTPLHVDQRRANLDDLDDTVSYQTTDSEISDDETNHNKDDDSERNESELENSDEDNSSWEPNESDYDETEPSPRKKPKLAKPVKEAEEKPYMPQNNLDASSDKLSTERGSVAESITDDRLNSSYNSSIKVPQVDDCIENTVDGSGIEILRHGTYVTKRYPCGMCGDGTWFTKPQRHFSKSHATNALFQEIEKLRAAASNPKCSAEEKKERESQIRVLQTTLLNQTVKQHNEQVIKDKKGVLVPVRLPPPDANVNANDFTFCLKCQGLFTKKGITEHMRISCIHKTKAAIGHRSFLKEDVQKLLLQHDTDQSEDLQEMLGELRDDEIGKAIRKDRLLLYIGSILIRRRTADEDNKTIRNRLRYLAKIVVGCKRENLCRCLFASELDSVYEVLNTFTPSVRIRMGQLLRSAMELMKSIAIKKDDSKMAQAMTNSIAVHDAEFKHQVGHKATMEQEKEKFMGNYDILPLSKDIKMLAEHLEEECRCCIEAYEKGHKNAKRSKKILASRVVLFNKRRGGEFVKSTRRDIEYALQFHRGVSHDIAEFQEILTDLEKHLASQMKLLRLPGKQGKGIPVLLDQLNQKLLKFLMEDPDLKTERFLFQSGNRRPLHSHNILSQITKEVPGLEKPEVLRATAMRKYCATALQMMELPKHQKAWVAEHLGHSLDVHGKYYRMPLDSVETAKITKLMYLMDHCKMNEVRGLNLNEVDTVITRDRLIQCTDEGDYADQLPDIFDKRNLDRCSKHVDDEAQSDIARKYSKVEKGEPLARRKQKDVKRSYWPADQERKVIEIFQNFIANKQCPNKAQCDEYLHLFPHCEGKYQRLKEKVNNLMTKGEPRLDSRKKQANDDE